jgi:hypothetical protein
MPWRFCLLLQLSWGTTAIASQLEAVERGLNNKTAEGEGDAESLVSEKVKAEERVGLIEGNYGIVR